MSSAPAPNQATVSFAPGMLLRGKYRVESLLGNGGMGVVVLALHLDLERRVAIKILHADLRENAELVERFVREGRAASRIEGAHVARVFDVDRLEDGTPFLVMEYLEGQDLSFVRKSQTPLPIAKAVEYVLQACSGVSLAHAAGVIHRDVKPANLFLTKMPGGNTMVKVLDFGISKLSGGSGASEPSVTRTTIVMGSVEYMSPEQMLSTRNVDARTDVWALGVVLFELVTAAPPFNGENTTQICAHVMSQPALKPRSLRPDLPPALEEIIMRCLEKERDRRYATVDELSTALRAALANLQRAGSAVSGPFTAAQPTPRMPDAPAGPFRPSSPSDHGGSNPRLSLPTTVLPDAARTSDTGPRAPERSGTRVSLGIPPVGSHTSVGVASDPIPEPPRRSYAAAYAAVAFVVCAALGTGWFLTRPSASVSKNAAPETGAAPAAPPNASELGAPSSDSDASGPSTATAHSAEPSAAISITPAASSSSTAEVPTAQPAKTAIASTTSVKTSARATSSPQSTATARATTKPTVKPSGID